MRCDRLIIQTALARLCGIAALVALATQLAAAQDRIDFAHQIVPLIQRYCAACHTNGRYEGGLSFDTRDDLVRSEVLDANDPDGGELLERLRSDDPETRMPLKKPPLSAAEVELFRRWIAEGLAWDDGFTFLTAKPGRPLALRPVALADGTPPTIDALIGPAAAASRPLIDDRTFLRRASLDLVGLLPTAESVEQFVADPASDKRTRLVDGLLADHRAFAEHWLTFWNDLLRNDYNGTGYIDGGRAPITNWLYQALLENKPYDAMVRELVAPAPASEGFIRGIKWRGRINASQLVELQFAQNVGQVFLGLNLKCASCHDSFIDSWKLSDAYGLAAIAAESPLEIHRCDVPQGQVATAAFLFPELGSIDPAAPREQRLRQLADLLTKPENGRLSRTIVNRLWQRLFGRGLVEPMDAMDSPAWNEDLLDWLAADLVAHHWDLKHTLRSIATSRAYQLWAVAPPSPGEPFEFRGPWARRLTAEQWLDGIWQLTEQWPKNSAVDFGYRDSRPVRASLVSADRLMRVLGRPNREQVVTARPMSLTALEAIDLNNGGQLAATLDSGAAALAARFKAATTAELVSWLYRSSLSREPSAEEARIATDWIGTPARPDALADLLWALTLQPEFCFVR
jgi:mono/diheme cytochrome c family protein